MESVDKQIEEGLKLIKPGRFCIFILPDEAIEEKRKNVIEKLCKNHSKGIYVNLGDNLDNVRELTSQLGVRKKLHLIAKPGKTIAGKNESEVSSNLSFVKLSMLIRELMSSKEHSFILFDSISSLLIRFSPPETKRFLHYMIKHTELVGLTGVGIATDDDSISKIIPDFSESELCLVVKPSKVGLFGDSIAGPEKNSSFLEKNLEFDSNERNKKKIDSTAPVFLSPAFIALYLCVGIGMFLFSPLTTGVNSLTGHSISGMGSQGIAGAILLFLVLAVVILFYLMDRGREK